MIKTAEQMSLPVGLAMLVWIGSLYLLSSFVLLLGGALSLLTAGIALILATAASLYSARISAHENVQIASIVAVGLLLGLSILCSGLIADTTIDGQSYHFHAIDALAHGWNPYYQPAPPLPDAEHVAASAWVTHYPMASWLVTAVQNAAGFPLEFSKGATIILMIGSALLVAAALISLNVGVLTSYLLAFVAAANPVTLAQLFTRMNDGLMASCLLSILALSVFAIRDRNRIALFCLAALIALAMNFKFSAVPILMAFCGLLVVASFVTQGRSPTVKFSGTLLLSGLLGAFCFGFFPYGLNILNYGHPFYPLMGADGTVDIMTGNTPEFMESKNFVSAFFYSLFAETHPGYVTVPDLKIPLTLSAEELRAAGGPDTRIGGFGPLFSGAIVIATIIALFTVFGSAKRSKMAAWALILAGALFVLALIFPESWWARYVPYLWVTPLLVALAAILSETQRLRYAGYALAGLLALNSVLVFGVSTYRAYDTSAAAYQQIANLKSVGSQYDVYFGLAFSRAQLFRDAGIEFDYLTAPPTDRNCPELAGFSADRFGGAVCETSD